MADVILLPLEPKDGEQFILDDQEAFNYGALVEFGPRDDHFEDEGEMISRETIEQSIDGGEPPRARSGEVLFCCPDSDVMNVFKIEKEEE